MDLIFYDGTVSDKYYISNLGRIYSISVKRFLTPYQDKEGHYRQTLVYPDGRTIFTGVHKIELMSFYPISRPDIFMPNHKDGIKTNNDISNLEWTTASQNTRHAYKNGLYSGFCENNSRSYISNKLVETICGYLERGYRTCDILNELNYKDRPERDKMGAIINNIKYGKAYMNISSKYDIVGLNGRREYSEEFIFLVCQFLADGNIYNYDDIAEFLQIPYNDRKLFKNMIEGIFKGRCGKLGRDFFGDKLRKPKGVPKEHPNYKYYN